MNSRPSNNRTILKFALLIAILAVCWYLGRVFDFEVSYYRGLLSRYSLVLSGAIFVLLYVVTTTFMWFGPKDVLRISSAVLFGATVSSIYVWIGEMINAVIMFYMSRILGREYVEQRVGAKTKDLDKMKADPSLLGVVAFRINPLVPFRLMDLGYGLSRIPFKKYFLGIVIVSFFRILWLQFILAGIGTGWLKDLSAMTDYFLENPRIVYYSSIYFLVVIIVTVAAFVMRLLRAEKVRNVNGINE